MLEPTPGVLIDSCLPRTAYQRCVAVYTWLVEWTGEAYEELDPGHQWMLVFGNLDKDDSEAADDLHVWPDHEDAIISQINRILPDHLICTVGEFQPGDVIVREVQEEDEEMT